MDYSEKTHCATKVTKDLRAYDVGLLRDARTVEDDSAKPSVHVDMKGGLTFRLPFDFNVAHFDVMKLICLAAGHHHRRDHKWPATTGRWWDQNHQLFATRPLVPSCDAGRH